MTPDRECHTYFFRVTDKPDVTAGGVTVSPRSLTVEFLAADGERTTRAMVTGPDRNPDRTLGPGRHTVTIGRERWDAWVAGLVGGCVPDGWER
jgi:hypothetical protein